MTLKRVGYSLLRLISLSIAVAYVWVLPVQAMDEATEKTNSSTQLGYKLGSGDQIKITVFNQQDLSGDYTVSGAGHLALPLIGEVIVKDLTTKQAKKRLPINLSLIIY